MYETLPTKAKIFLFTNKINMYKKMAIALIFLGLFILILGMSIGLKNIKPIQMNVISGIVIVIGTCFGLFGKKLQDLGSSEKSDKILLTGTNTNEKVDLLKNQNIELQKKADTLNNKLETQAETIDKLRLENTNLYDKLALSQTNIFNNTERTLQPLSINSLSVNLSYKFDNPKIKQTLSKILELKKQIENIYSTVPPAIDGKRYLPATPGIDAFPDDNNKISTPFVITDEVFINSMGFEIPNIVMQISKEYPTEKREKLKEGTHVLNSFSSFLLEMKSYQLLDPNKVNSVYVDIVNKKINFAIQIVQWHYTPTSGELSSFMDIFEKYLKVSVFYNYFQDNKSKIEIVSAFINNDKKRLQFLFNDIDKSKSKFEFNAAMIHVISKKDLIY